MIPQARLEQSLLIESSEEARMLIIGHAPTSVYNAWTLAGDDVRARGAYSNDPTKNNRYFRVCLFLSFTISAAGVFIFAVYF